MNHDDRLAALHQRLAERAAVELKLLDTYLANPTPRAMPDIVQGAHKMAGIAPMLGEIQLGKAAHDVDTAGPARPNRQDLLAYQKALEEVISRTGTNDNRPKALITRSRTATYPSEGESGQ